MKKENFPPGKWYHIPEENKGRQRRGVEGELQIEIHPNEPLPQPKPKPDHEIGPDISPGNDAPGDFRGDIEDGEEY